MIEPKLAALVDSRLKVLPWFLPKRVTKATPDDFASLLVNLVELLAPIELGQQFKIFIGAGFMRQPGFQNGNTIGISATVRLLRRLIADQRLETAD